MTDLQSKDVCVRKAHPCEWCGEVILIGEVARYRAYMWEGDFISAWQHPECYIAMCASDPEDLEQGWTMGDFQRGEGTR